MFSSTYFSWDVRHSWVDYIYSLPMLYDGLEPFVISKLISAFPSQNSPILPNNNS